MCSAAVFLVWCSLIRINWKSICSGVAPISRANWFSVWIFFGIRLRRPILSGRMSWCIARSGVITMTPSFDSTPKAGSVSGRVMGMGVSLRECRR